MDLFKVTAWGIDSRQPNPEMKVLCDEYCFAESAEAAFQKTFNSHPGQAVIKSIIDKSHKGELHYNIQKVELPSLKPAGEPTYLDIYPRRIAAFYPADNIPKLVTPVPAEIKPPDTATSPPVKPDTKIHTPPAPHKGRRHKRSI